jgi:hypothetical protein
VNVSQLKLRSEKFDDDFDDDNNMDAWITLPKIHLRLSALELWNKKSSRPCADVTFIVVLILELAVLFKYSCTLCSYNVLYPVVCANKSVLRVTSSFPEFFM